MTIPSLPSLDRTSPTFKTDLDAFFLTQLPATIPAFNAEIERINLVAFGAYSATSTTSLSIATGSKSLTIEAGKSFAIGQPVLIASTAAPANWMHGQVTAYDSGTGALTVTVGTISGSGTVAAWSVSVTAVVPAAAPSLTQRTITSTDTLIASDQGKLINCSGTFTLSVTAAATLGNGWWCYVRNTGTGTVTLDPNGTETVDGVATGPVAGTILLACNGTSFTAVKIGGFDTLQLLTSGTSWTAPLGVRRARVRGVGGGGGGGRSSDAAEGSPGAGGGYFEGIYPTTPGTAYTYAIGAAGVKASATGAAGTAGGNTSITINGVTLTGNGGGAGQASFTSSSVGGAASNGQINISGSSGVCYAFSGSGTSISVPGSAPLGLGSVHDGRQGYGYGGRGGSSLFVGDNGAAGVIILEY